MADGILENAPTELVTLSIIFGARRVARVVWPYGPRGYPIFDWRILHPRITVSPLSGTISRPGCIVTLWLTGRIPRVHPQNDRLTTRGTRVAAPQRTSDEIANVRGQ